MAGLGPTNIELTTAWGVNASYEHFWSPRWRTSLHGGYVEVSYGGLANAILCTQLGFGAGGTGAFAVAQAGCSNDWNWWWIGSRTQWNVTKDFYLGLDVAYTRISGLSTPTGFYPSANGVAALLPGNTNLTARRLDDQDTWLARFRVHRDFYP